MRNIISFSFAAVFMVSSMAHANEDKKAETLELPAIVITAPYPSDLEDGSYSAEEKADRQAEESLSKLVEANVSTENNDD